MRQGRSKPLIKIGYRNIREQFLKLCYKRLYISHIFRGFIIHLSRKSNDHFLHSFLLKIIFQKTDQFMRRNGCQPVCYNFQNKLRARMFSSPHVCNGNIKLETTPGKPAAKKKKELEGTFPGSCITQPGSLLAFWIDRCYHPYHLVFLPFGTSKNPCAGCSDAILCRGFCV